MAKEHKHTGPTCEFCKPVMEKVKDSTGKTVEQVRHDIAIAHPFRVILQDAPGSTSN